MPVSQRSRLRPRFSPPRQRTGMLRRERLFARLSIALDTDGVLLLAPSGYGKTTLVVDWLRESEIEAAWLALNPSHRDPRALGSDLVGALARIHPAVQSLSERLDAGDGPQDASAIWFELARALEDVDDFAMLVVDDLDELIGADEALALLDRLIADPLPGVHPVLAARRPPELPSRPRKAAAGDLTVLDAGELAFTDLEAETLLDQAGILDATARASICARAGGWPLALALLSNRTSEGSRPGGARAEAALEEFIDSEVLGGLTGADRAFLEACAVPSYFDGDIAAELTQRTDAASALRGLLGRVQLLDAVGDGPWLRMHSLLREHCLARLAREDPARLRELRRRAALALAGRGELDEATDLALSAEAWPQALELISRQAEQLTGRGAWGTLAGWLARLPREVLSETPALALLEVRVVIRLMRLPGAHALLDRLDAARLAPGDQAQALLYRAVAFRQARRLDDARREHRRARALIEEHEPSESVRRVEADFEEGTTLGMAGDVVPSVRLLRRAAEAAEIRGSARLAAESYQNLGLALQLAGQLGAAQEVMREARRRWEFLGEREFQLLALNNEATAAQALGDLDAAAAAYQEVAEQARELGIRRMQALGELGLADIARDRGELDAADPHYNEASRIAREIDHAGVEAAAAFGKAMGLRERGALAEARTLLEHHLQVTQEQGTSEFVTRFRIGLAGVLLSEGRPDEAHAALDEVLRAPGGGLQRRQLALLMRATAEFRLGRQGDVAATLTELQGLVEGLGYDQFIVAEARLCADLLVDERVAALPGGYYAGLLRRAQPSAVTTPSLEQRAAAAQPDFVVRALGKLTVTRPGDARSDLQWRGQRSKELFLFLLVSGRAVSREEVDEALWPEAPPSRLASLFHSALHRLRRAMGQDTVLHDRGGYDLNPALLLEYDVRAFEEQLAKADRARNDEERAGALKAAVAAYRGEFAPHVDSPWVEATRERLASRYVSARLALAADALAASRFAEAVTHAEAALEVDAFSDEAARHLIAAHVGAGHPDLALRAYRRLQDLLEQDSRAVASRDTLRALERALSQGPSRT